MLVTAPGLVAAEAGQRATAPEAAATAATTVDVATAIVSRAGFLCMGLLRGAKRTFVRVRMRTRLSPVALAGHRFGRGKAAACRRGADQGDGVTGGNRHARWVLSVLHTAQRTAALGPENAQRTYEMNHTFNVPVTNFVAVFTIPVPGSGCHQRIRRETRVSQITLMTVPVQRTTLRYNGDGR